MLAAILVHYRRPDSAQACVQQLLEQEQPLSKVYVVDNSAGECPFPLNVDPRVCVLDPGRNLGYAAGANLGLRMAVADAGNRAFLLVTHEVRMDRKCVAALVAAVGPGVGVVGPLLGDAARPDVLWGAGGESHPRGYVTHNRVPARITEWQATGNHAVDWVDGACLLITREAIERAGFFDERYFLYFEDVAFCRACRRAGLSVNVAADAVAWQSAGNIPFDIYARNRLLYAEGELGRLKTSVHAVTGILRDIKGFRLGGEGGPLRARARGAYWYLTRQFGDPRSRSGACG